MSANGEEALAALDRERFDLILTDLRMPGLDGLAFVSMLRERLPGIPIVIMTGHGNFAEPDPDPEAAVVAAVLWKPLNLREISRKLHDILE